MLGKQTNDDGLAGVSALIIFIALVLVSAIAAGVVLDTAGFLQETASTTGEESTDQVSNTLNLLATVGIVNEDSGDYEVDQVRADVVKAPGSENLNLSKSTVKVVTDQGSETLLYGEGNNVGQFEGADIDATAGQFGVKPLRDSDDSYPVITQDTDRHQYRINFTDDGEVLDPIEGGDDVTIRIISPTGGVTLKDFNVPTTLPQDDGAAVEL